MVNKTTLTLLATAITSAAAVDIQFRRFSTTGCEDTYHIRKDTHLHEPHCKTFSEHEPPFNSFIITGDDDKDDMIEDMEGKQCYATVYDQKDCKGQAAVFHEMKQYMSACAAMPFAARSVKISCEDKPSKQSELDTATFVTSVQVPTTALTQVMSVTTDPTETGKVFLVPGDGHHHDDGHHGWCPLADGTGAMRKVRRGESCS